MGLDDDRCALRRSHVRAVNCARPATDPTYPGDEALQAMAPERVSTIGAGPPRHRPGPTAYRRVLPARTKPGPSAAATSIACSSTVRKTSPATSDPTT